MSTIGSLYRLWPQTPRSGVSPRDIPDVGRDDLAQLFSRLNFTRGVEVGTERGLYAEVLCQSNPRLRLTCVDPYLAYRGYREHRSQNRINGFYREAQTRLAPYNCKFLRLPSIDAAAHFADESLDFVYIDGNHGLLWVIQDLCYWVPKVRRGGIVSGHDFIQRRHTGYAMHVVQAMHAYTQSFGIDPWFVLGRKACLEGEVRDKPRSWMWVR